MKNALDNIFRSLRPRHKADMHFWGNTISNACIVLVFIFFNQSPTGVLYAPIFTDFCFVSPTIAVGLWLRPLSSSARLYHMIHRGNCGLQGTYYKSTIWQGTLNTHYILL
jgi:hypothetical protein